MIIINCWCTFFIIDLIYTKTIFVDAVLKQLLYPSTGFFKIIRLLLINHKLGEIARFKIVLQLLIDQLIYRISKYFAEFFPSFKT